jgi:segregation and condensation protein B
MSDVDVIPELKQIVGALLFAAKEPVTMEQMKQVFATTAEQHGGVTKDFAEVTDGLLTEAVAQLNEQLRGSCTGMHVQEMAHGYRLVNDTSCGPWLRTLLEKGKPQRLSRPALETLAIIAYRQPVVRSEIEAVRGVAVDAMIRNLLDMQLVRVVGRSDLPGRPWLFGTTQKFLEHFGIKSVDDLPGTDELRRLEAEQLRRKEPAGEAAGEADEAPVEESAAAGEDASGEEAVSDNAPADQVETGAEVDEAVAADPEADPDRNA